MSFANGGNWFCTMSQGSAGASQPAGDVQPLLKMSPEVAIQEETT